MLDINIKKQLKEHFSNISREVRLSISTDESKASSELLELANELSELSDHITISKEGVTNQRSPLLSIFNKELGTEINFAGVPMGHEFTSLILAILHSGGHDTKLSDDQISQATSIKESMDVEIFISMSCQNCPDVVQAFNKISTLNPSVKTTMIDGALFQDEAKEREILAVPSVFINGELFGQGRMSLGEILSKLDDGSAKEREAEELNSKDAFDVLVVGGGPSGATSAIYSARKGLKTGIVAERFGGQVLDTVSIENFISVTATTGSKLVANLEEHVKEYDVDIMEGNLVESITERKDSPDDLIHVHLSNGATLKTKSLIGATGARWRKMGVSGEEEYKGKGVAYCPHCDGPLFKGKRTIVVGGGNSGIEAAIDLSGIVEHVTVLEFSDTLRADQVLIDKANNTKNIEIIKMAQTTEVIGDGRKVTDLTYIDRNTGNSIKLPVSGIFVQIGLVPNSEWLDGTSVTLTDRKEIVTAGDGSTDSDGVFAAGDVTTVLYKQIIIAMGEGAKASLGAFDYLIRR
ncbi:alkyl hydroperoxide reductase, AhpF component [Vibrio chagasii]|nr:alkyl hydroperoxide reductase, AhpF component [Vibrio chagasii]